MYFQCSISVPVLGQFSRICFQLYCIYKLSLNKTDPVPQKLSRIYFKLSVFVKVRAEEDDRKICTTFSSDNFAVGWVILEH